ncbi:hypothetical protein HDU67_007822 [Dinochytrium kinnereticum]|nr:hypothetical protein HDU67_007822 [Dinochytrium kinnereticum]
MPALLAEPVLTLAFSNLEKLKCIDEADISTIWAVFTKVKDNLENGRRLENMSWRLWFRSSRHSGPVDLFASCISTTSSSNPSSPLSPHPSDSCRPITHVPPSPVRRTPSPSTPSRATSSYAPIAVPPAPSSPAQAPASLLKPVRSSRGLTRLNPSSSSASMIVARIPTPEQQQFQLQQPIQPFIFPSALTATAQPIVPVDTSLHPRYVAVLPHLSQQQLQLSIPPSVKPAAPAPRVKFFISSSGTPSDDGMQQATTSALARAASPNQCDDAESVDEEYDDEDAEGASDFYSDEEEGAYSDDMEDEDDRFYYSDDDDGAVDDAFADASGQKREEESMFAKIGLPTSTIPTSSLSSSFASAFSASTVSSRFDHSALTLPSTHNHRASSPNPTTTTTSTRSLLSAALENSGLRRGHPSLIKNLSTMGAETDQGSIAPVLGDWRCVEGHPYAKVKVEDVNYFERVGEQGERWSESLRENVMCDRRLPFHFSGGMGRVTRAEGSPESFSGYCW